MAIRLYSTNSDVYALGPEFGDIHELVNNDPLYEKVKHLTPGKGLWLYDQPEQKAMPVWRYYQNIYNESFSKQIGIMEVKITDNVISGMIDKVKTKTDDSIIVLSQDNQLLFTDIEETGRLNALKRAAADAMADGASKYAYLRDVNLLGNSINVDPLAIKIISFTNGREVNIQRELQWFAWGGVL
ncbi:hypothetical protein AB4Z21_35440, partial [Paenibacillus sp. MCAF20]